MKRRNFLTKALVLIFGAPAAAIAASQAKKKTYPILEGFPDIVDTKHPFSNNLEVYHIATGEVITLAQRICQSEGWIDRYVEETIPQLEGSVFAPRTKKRLAIDYTIDNDGLAHWDVRTERLPGPYALRQKKADDQLPAPHVVQVDTLADVTIAESWGPHVPIAPNPTTKTTP